jgi:hypothetical protein
MSNLFIQGTKSTPTVEFNGQQGTLLLAGASYPENAYTFYKPVLDWTKEFTQEIRQPVILKIDLKYLNTSSTKCLMNLLRLLAESEDGGKWVSVHWFYDQGNDTILEVAQEFQTGIKLDFSIVPK